METAILLWFLAFALIVTGLVGLVLPAIPGALLVFAGLLLAAWAEDFTYVGTWTIVALAVLTLLSYGVDFWATMFGAKKFGASKGAILGAVIGSVIGELLAQRGLSQAARAGFGATIGLVLGAAIKIALAFSMIGIFLVARFFGFGG